VLPWERCHDCESDSTGVVDHSMKRNRACSDLSIAVVVTA